MKERIKQIRAALSLTQTEFAKQAGISRSIVAAYEGGNAPISERTMNDICRVFNVNEQWLRTGEGPMFREQDNLDNMLAAEVAKLVRSEDDFTKNLVYQYLALPQDAKDKVKDFVLALTKEK